MNTDIGVMDINDGVIRLFRSKSRLDSFLSMKGTPKTVLEEEQRIYRERILHLNTIGFDAEKYINSDKGKVAFLLWQDHEKYQENLNERCYRCTNWYQKFLSTGKSGCSLSLNEHDFKCPSFIDSGKDWDERNTESTYRCLACKHSIIFKDEKSELKCKKLKCLKECNEFDCKIYEEGEKKDDDDDESLDWNFDKNIDAEFQTFIEKINTNDNDEDDEEEEDEEDDLPFLKE